MSVPVSLSPPAASPSALGGRAAAANEEDELVDESCRQHLLEMTVCYDEWPIPREEIPGALRKAGLAPDPLTLEEYLGELEQDGLPMSDMAEIAYSVDLISCEDMLAIRRVKLKKRRARVTAGYPTASSSR